MDEEYLAGFVDEGQLTNNEMTGVYKALSISGEKDIDSEEELQFVQNCIDELYSENVKKLPTEDIQKNSELVNKLFFELIKHCKIKNYKNIGYMFIGFCDYFDLNVSKVYAGLHEKIQFLLQNACKKMIGETNYQKLKTKNRREEEAQGIVKGKSLLDLFGNK